MALAPYFARAATAAAQAISGFDADAFRTKLEATCVGIAVGSRALGTDEGRALLDLVVRLVARLYPRVLFVSSGGTLEPLSDLARAINPAIELGGDPTHSLVLGDDAPAVSGRAFFLGSDGWTARVSTIGPRAIGETDNPVGAGAAACIGAGNLFRSLFILRDLSDNELELSVARLLTGRDVSPTLAGLNDGGATALAGLGAIGNGLIWTLARSPVVGEITCVDAQLIELPNLQRYVLATVADVNRPKVELAREHLSNLKAVAQRMRWEEFVSTFGYRWDRVLVGLDSIQDRRLLQGSLPKWIANGWTQVGELGLSTHTFGGDGPCLCCVYLPHEPALNEDQRVTTAFGLPLDDAHVRQIRDLLYRRLPPPRALLEEIATARHVDMEMLEPYATRPLRDLYVEAVCGGGIVALSGASGPDREVHVPLAHQSAFAGVLVAAAYVLDIAGVERPNRELVRINPMRRFPADPIREVAKDARCICGKRAFLDAYSAKYVQP